MRKEVILSPCSGIISQLCVHTGDVVKEGDRIVEVEIMKLLYPATAGIDGHVTLMTQLGEFVNEGDAIAEVIEFLG